MTKRKPKMSIMELGTVELASLMNKSDRRIRVMCSEKKLVARRAYPGASWRILLPEDEYNDLLEIKKLRDLNMKK